MLTDRSARILRSAIRKHHDLIKRAHALAPWLVTEEDVARSRGAPSDRDRGRR